MEESVQKHIDSTRSEIINDILLPSYEDEIASANKSKNRWRKLAQCVNTLGQLLLIASAVMGFSAGFFKLLYLAFVSGTLSVLCLSLFLFAVYAERESNHQSEYLSGMLSRLNIRSSLSIGQSNRKDSAQ